MIYAAKTVCGRRAQNQDGVFIPKGRDISLVAVADGMGGHNAGDVASALAISTLTSEMKRGGPGGPAALMNNAFNKANTVIYDKALTSPELRGMGTTLVAALLFNSSYIAANVGDSRLYHIASDCSEIKQITSDHSYVAELVAMGYITKEEAAHHPRRNLITRALGTRPCERVDIFECDWASGDCVLLCSDGLYSVIDDSDILDIMRATRNPGEACDTLVGEALERGSSDNVSAVITLNGEAARP